MSPNQIDWDAFDKPLQPLPQYYSSNPFVTPDTLDSSFLHQLAAEELEHERLRKKQEQEDQAAYKAFVALKKAELDAMEAQQIESIDDPDLIDPPDFEPMNLGKEPS